MIFISKEMIQVDRRSSGKLLFEACTLRDKDGCAGGPYLIFNFK
jgi:hypothetical protein